MKIKVNKKIMQFVTSIVDLTSVYKYFHVKNMHEVIILFSRFLFKFTTFKDVGILQVISLEIELGGYI